METKTQIDRETMEKMKRAAAVTGAHKALEPMAGKWTFTASFWMTPDGEPEVTEGKSENTMVLGGRFLKQKVSGTWMGEPYAGIGFTGYDNVRGEYESIWMDGMSTGIMKASGSRDADTNTLMLSGKNSCPMTGEKDYPSRSTTQILDADNHIFTAYGPAPDGKEFKQMEIVYMRA